MATNKILAARIVDQNHPPMIGEVLPNSWHNACDCDWVEEDTELDGTCAFEIQSRYDSGALLSALGFAGSQWPGVQLIAIVEGDRGRSDMPEDGGITVSGARVIGLFWWEC